MTFKKILVPLDGSTNSEQVLAWLTGLAGRLEAELVLLAVADDGEPDAIARGAESYLKLQAKALQERGVRIKTVVEPGKPADAILAAASRIGADMIAMATHRHHMIERGILGSVTDSVLRSSTLPVLAVNPDGDHISSPKPATPSTLIVPLDGSQLAEESIPIALAIAAACEAKIIFIRAVHLPGYAVSGPGAEFYGMDFGVAGQRDEARKYLAKFVAQAESKGIEATAHAALGNAAGRILEDTRSVPDAMIVISSHGRGGFKRMMLGSVADKIIRASHHPVLVLKHA